MSWRLAGRDVLRSSFNRTELYGGDGNDRLRTTFRVCGHRQRRHLRDGIAVKGFESRSCRPLGRDDSRACTDRPALLSAIGGQPRSRCPEARRDQAGRGPGSEPREQAQDLADERETLTRPALRTAAGAKCRGRKPAASSAGPRSTGRTRDADPDGLVPPPRGRTSSS